MDQKNFRREAEEILKNKKGVKIDTDKLDLSELFHELQVYQIELELQNEELQKAHNEVSKSRDKFSDLYDFSPVGYLTLSAEGKILDVNLTFADMVAMSKSALKGSDFTKLVVGSRQDDFYFAFRKAAVENKSSKCDIEIIRKSGYFHAIAELKPNFGREGDIYCAVIDVSDKIKAGKSLEIQNDLAFSLNSIDNLAEALDKIADSLLKPSSIDAAAIHLFDPEAKSLNISASRGLSESLIEARSIQGEGTFPLDRALKLEPVFLEYDEINSLRTHADLKEDGFTSAALYPITHNGALVATLFVMSRTLRKVPENYKFLIGSISGVIGSAIARFSAESKLKASEEFHRSLLDKMVESAVIVDSNLKFVYANESFAKSIDMTKTEVIGKSIRDVFPGIRNGGDDLEKFEDIIKNRKTSEFEYKVRRESGNHSWFSLHFRPVEEGSFILALDITERKRAEERIRYEAFLLENVTDAVISTNLDFEIVSFNSAAERIYGYKESDVIGKPFGEMTETRYQNGVDSESAMKELIENEFWSGEVVQFHKNGNSVEILSGVKILKNSDGQPMGAVAINRDVTERNKYLRAIEESEKKYKLIAELISDYVYSATLLEDGGYEVEWFVGAIERICGYSQSEYWKLGWHNLVHPEDFERISASLNKLKKNEIVINEYRLIAKSGEYRWLRDYVKPRVDKATGEIVGFVGAVQDIHDRRTAEEIVKKSEKELKNLNASKDKFFSIIAHDLKNPIGAFLSLSQMLMESYRDLSLSEIEETIRALNESSANLYALLENLLNWSRTQTGSVIVQAEDFEADEVIQSIVGLHKSAADQKNVSLEVEESDARFFADPNMIETVLRNLVSNAIKFTPRGGKIVVAAKTDGDETIISIEDNGVGMSEKTKNDLFQIDKNVSSQGTENERGTGLGLILCKELIERNSGRLIFESELGKGSKFFVALPSGKKS